MVTGYGTETYTSQTKSPTWPANTVKDSYEVFTYFLCLLLLMHTPYFALLKLSLKLQFCDEASLEFPFNFPGFVCLFALQYIWEMECYCWLCVDHCLGRPRDNGATLAPTWDTCNVTELISFIRVHRLSSFYNSGEIPDGTRWHATHSKYENSNSNNLMYGIAARH